MYFHKAQEKPQRWGDFQSIQYSIKRNLESIYLCDPDDEVLIMPLFWGFPCWDFSGKGNHGVNHGATYKDGSLDFDGGDDYVLLSNAGNMYNNPSGKTFLWIKPDFASNDAGTYHILSKEYTPDLGWQIVFANGVLYAGFESSGWKRALAAHSTDFSWNAGDWVNLAWTWDSSANLIKIYINGENVGTDFTGAFSVPNFPDTEVCPIGGFMSLAETFSAPFNGTIDEVRISNPTRTAETIGIFYERPWDLYRRVSRPVYFLPSVPPPAFTPRIMMF